MARVLSISARRFGRFRSISSRIADFLLAFRPDSVDFGRFGRFRRVDSVDFGASIRSRRFGRVASCRVDSVASCRFGRVLSIWSAACVAIRSIRRVDSVAIRSVSVALGELPFVVSVDFGRVVSRRSQGDTKDKTQKKPDSSIVESGSAIARRRALLTFDSVDFGASVASIRSRPVDLAC